MNYEIWMDKAKENLKKLPTGTKFVLKELFKGTEWNELTKGEKLSFGRYFKNEVNDCQVNGVTFLDKAPNNSAVYIRQ